MKRGRISISVVLSLLIVMFLMIMGCSSSDNAVVLVTPGTESVPVFAGNYISGTNGKTIPSIWTVTEGGGILTPLNGDRLDDESAYSPAVSYGGKIYTAGAFSDGTNPIPCYWTVTGEDTM